MLLLFLPLLLYLCWRPCSILAAKRKARFKTPPPVVAAPVASGAPMVEEMVLQVVSTQAGTES